jgi:type II secretory pathway pseudopilin PulG
MGFLHNITKGQSLIELLLAMGLAAILLPALLTGLITSREGRPQTIQRNEASTLIREAAESLRSVRESGWSAVSTNGTYHTEVSGNRWTLVSGSQTVNGYTKSIVISDTYRNSSGAIVQSGGVIDPSTKAIAITVSWTTPYPSSITSNFYLTRYLDNIAITHTSQADFNLGTISNLAVTNTAGGELTLSPNNKAKWCSPTLSDKTIDLPGRPNAVTAEPGHVYVATGQNAVASEESFSHVLVSLSDPVTFTLSGKLKGYKTYDVFGESDAYGYIATSDNSKEIVIVDLKTYTDVPNKILAESGYFNTPSNSTDADTVFVLGNRGYMTAGQYLYVFDLSSKSGSRSQIGTRINFANAGDKAGDIYVRNVGGSVYVYIAIEGSTPEELKIANVTNHNNSSTWRIIGSINIEPNNCSSLESGKAIYVKPDGSRAYVSSINDTSFKEFFVINTSNKSSPSLVGGFATNPPCTNGGGYEAGGMNPEQSVVVSAAENRAILVGVDDPNDAIDSMEYQVLDLSNEGTPTMCGGFDYDAGIYGVAGVTEPDGDTFAYLITGDSSNELKVVQGGPDGNYLDNGTYESVVVDPGYQTAYNRLTASVATPANTSIKIQVAVADAVSGSCTGANFQFIGPDGTSGSYFTPVNNQIIAPIPHGDYNPNYHNPGRCFKYKAYFSSTDFNSTPTLYDITINNSP